MPKKDDDIIGFEFTDSGVADVFKKFGNIQKEPEGRQALFDAAIVLEAAVKKELRSMVYDKPETWYRRKAGAGLLGATKATGKVKIKGDEIATGVVSKKGYAPYIYFGTGIHAADGKGRKTPWWYMDEDGNFHRTVGMVPKPYMTEGAKQSLRDVMKVIGIKFMKQRGK